MYSQTNNYTSPLITNTNPLDKIHNLISTLPIASTIHTSIHIISHYNGKPPS